MAVATTLLLVDDHPLYHAGLTSAMRVLKPDCEVLSAVDAAHGLAMLAESPQIDLVLLDIVLPGTDGFEAVSQYGAAFPAVPRVLISGREDGSTQARASRCGASGFICKSWPVDRIVQTIEKVLAGESGFDLQADESRRVDGARQLTLRQLEVLGLLAQGKSNKEIARALDIADRTVRAHLTELFQALDARSRTQALLNAQSLGLVQ